MSWEDVTPMNLTSEAPRALCLRCRRALSACWCDPSSVQRTQAELVLLQHPRESRNPIGTARMAHLGVQDSKLRVGVRFAEDPAIQAMLADPTRRNVVLYPAANARPAAELRGQEASLRIFILDGTWWQAKKLWNTNPWLHALPAYRLNPSAPGQYRIRREPAAHCLATIEAVTQFLDVLGDEEGAHEGLLRPFQAMVEKQIAHAQSPKRAPRLRKRPRTKRVCLPLQELVASLPRLLLVYAEGNGWPLNKPRVGAHAESGEVELMQWLAVRPATGETFHALVKTRTRAPSALYQQELTETQLAGAIPKEEFLQRWQAFARDDDAWCAWGHAPEFLMRRAGGKTAAALNLQQVCNLCLGSRMQHTESALRAMGEPAVTAEFPGRGGLRIAQLAATVRGLISRHGSGEWP